MLFHYLKKLTEFLPRTFGDLAYERPLKINFTYLKWPEVGNGKCDCVHLPIAPEMQRTQICMNGCWAKMRSMPSTDLDGGCSALRYADVQKCPVGKVRRQRATWKSGRSLKIRVGIHITQQKFQQKKSCAMF